MTMDKSSGDIIVAREDAIFYYGPNGRGPCYAFEGPKSLVGVFKNYITLVSPPENKSKSQRASLRGLGGSQAEDIFNTSTFTVLDTDLKYIAHTQSIVSQVRTSFSEWGDFFVLTGDGKVRRGFDV
jgi:hypothetical protein